MRKIFFAIALLSILGTVFSTACGDGSTCPEKNTCCLTPVGDGCCPFENGTCCGDGMHCCPNGYQCDITKGACVANGKENSFLTYLEESTPAKLTESTGIFGFLPSPLDIIKCVSSAKHLGQGIYNAIKEFKSGSSEGKERAREYLKNILKDGALAGSSCIKLILKLIK